MGDNGEDAYYAQVQYMTRLLLNWPPASESITITPPAVFINFLCSAKLVDIAPLYTFTRAQIQSFISIITSRQQSDVCYAFRSFVPGLNTLDVSSAE